MPRLAVVMQSGPTDRPSRGVYYFIQRAFHKYHPRLSIDQRPESRASVPFPHSICIGLLYSAEAEHLDGRAPEKNKLTFSASCSECRPKFSLARPLQKLNVTPEKVSPGELTRQDDVIKEEAMKFTTAILTAIMFTATPVLASSEAQTTGISLLVLLFLGFGALIVACQLVPSLMLFCSMLKGLFRSAAHDTMPKPGAKAL